MTTVTRARGAAASLGFYLGLAALIAIVLVLVPTGVLSERRWGPFGDVRVWRFILEGLFVTLQIGAVALVASLILAVPLTLGAYLAYVLSEANVERAIASGAAEAGIEAWCRERLEPVFGCSSLAVLFTGYVAYVTAAVP